MHFKTYKSLGIQVLEEKDEEVICLCPFCGKDKLYIQKEEGLFDCKTCNRSGNKYTFMKFFYEDYLASTTLKHYSQLSAFRDRLPAEAFAAFKLAYHLPTKEWIFPVRNPDGNLINLRFWNRDTNILRNLAACSAGIFNIEKMNGKGKVYVCEGEWDAIALQWLLDSSDIDTDDSAIIAVPGANTFKKEWAGHFFNKEVTLLFDKDAAGIEGTRRVAGILKENVATRSIKYLKWPDSYPEKYDIRDLVTVNLKSRDKCFNILDGFIEDISSLISSVEGKIEVNNDIKTFDELVAAYSKHIYVTSELRKALLLEVSVVLSNALKDSPLWLFVVGPVSGGKSLLLQSLADLEQTHYLSTLSPKALISGWKAEDGSDSSLLPSLIGKTLIIKEYTEIMALSIQDQEKIFSTLRGVYDGRVDVTFGNKVCRTYPEPGSGHETCHFTILAGVTNTIHANNRAALGERFLKFQIMPGKGDALKQIRFAMNNTLKQEFPEFELRKYATSFINYLTSKDLYVPSVPNHIQDRIIGLAQLVAVIRANVERKMGELAYRPTPEVGARLSKQLLKLSQSIGITLQKKEVDDECYELVQRVGLDTCYGWHRDAIMEIAKHENGLVKRKLCEEAVMTSGVASKCLDDLYELEAIERTALHDGGVGQPAYIYKVTPHIKELFKLARINTLPSYETNGKPKFKRFTARKTGTKGIGKADTRTRSTDSTTLQPIEGVMQ